MSERLSPVNDRQRRPEEGGTELLNVLGDECSRRILSATSERPMTVKELTERCSVSSTTVYRRINTLVDRGLLYEKPTFPSDGASKKLYESTVRRIETTVDGGGFTVHTYGERTDHGRIVELLSGVPEDDITVDVEDGELRLSAPLNGELLGAVTWAEGTMEREDDV